MNLEKLKSQWEDYVYQNILDEDVRPNIAMSWEKCRKKQVDPMDGLGRRTDPRLFESIRSSNKWLIDIALPIMHNLFEIVSGSNNILVLTDSCGYILEAIGDEEVNKSAKNLHFEQGMLWNEETVGSNAIGIAVDQDVQIQMSGAEHYCITHHGFTCSAAPIHGLNGELVGCLNISGYAGEVHCHTLGIVVAAAFGIETQILQKHSADLMRTALDSSTDGIVILNKAFQAIWMNRSAENIMFMGLSELEKYDFRKIMPDINWVKMDKLEHGKPYTRTECRLIVNSQIYACSANISPNVFEKQTIGYTVSFARMEKLLHTVNKVTGNCAAYTFDDILVLDPLMRRTVQLAQKYARYDGNILIEGESGTGKELFAQAIHNASSRAEAPFIAINCSTLPRDLVESELFGYEKGAFTGALKEGKPGKFELADGGTIFLDEIGEMPLEFQAKLLRVVETHQVLRIGGIYEKKLDIRVIVATNRDLKTEVAQKNFREDLYFRFNVLKLSIPPLRDRPSDITYCAQNFLEHFNSKYPDQRKRMDEEFIHQLNRYDWPGNVRELQNCIERSFYTSTGPVLTDPALNFSLFEQLHPKEENVSKTPGLPGTLEELEERNIGMVLESCDGDVNLAAQKLGISRASMYRRLKKFGIQTRTMVHSQE